jgi:hypothetical protein|tara:strand:- start:4096 stop:4764 length:669 start_codon:yes stop_codon:yes gene_type:complete
MKRVADLPVFDKWWVKDVADFLYPIDAEKMKSDYSRDIMMEFLNGNEDRYFLNEMEEAIKFNTGVEGFSPFVRKMIPEDTLSPSRIGDYCYLPVENFLDMVVVEQSNVAELEKMGYKSGVIVKFATVNGRPEKMWPFSLINTDGMGDYYVPIARRQLQGYVVSYNQAQIKFKPDSRKCKLTEFYEKIGGGTEGSNRKTFMYRPDADRRIIQAYNFSRGYRIR